MNIDYFQIVVTTRAGVQTAIMSSSAGASPVLGMEFDLLRDGGCNDLSFVVSRDSMERIGTIQVGYIVTVKVKTTTASLTSYWVGVITRIPKAGNTDRAWRFEARGLWFAELAEQRIVNYYEGQDVDDLVKTILAEIDTPVTAISTTASEVDVASPYNVADYEVEFEPADEVIRQLAILQDNVQYGVDQEGRLYFKDDSTVNVEHFWVGTHVSSIDVQEHIEDIVNDVYAQSKQVVGGGSLTLHRDDATSKTAYGYRTKVVQVRNTKETADVARYADSIISRQKDPVQEVEAALPTFSNFRFPRGNVRITDTNGTVYSFPIQRVSYTLDPTAGFIGRMEIGNKPKPTIEQQFRDVINRIERVNANAISLSKIEHTRGEEFAQAAIVDARKAGLLNIFTDTLDNLKSFDASKSSHMQHRGTYILGPFEFLAAIHVSNPIPSGDEVDSVRWYGNVDMYGRIDFERDDDWTYFFEGIAGASPLGLDNVSDWRQNEDGLGLEQFQAGGDRMFYRRDNLDVPTGQTGFRVNPPLQVDILYRHDPAATTFQRLYWGYNAITDEWVAAEIDNSGASMTVKLRKRLAGVTSTEETLTVTGDTDYVIRGISSGGFHTVQVWDETLTTMIDSTAAYNISTGVAGVDVGFSDFFGGGIVQARIGWFQLFDQFSTISISVSRDGGTTFTATQAPNVNQGFAFRDFNVSAQPSGTNLVAKIRLRHPTRMYGWGLAW